MAIPCPIHNPKAWELYMKKHGAKVDWSREAEIARGCCADCHDASVPNRSEDK